MAKSKKSKVQNTARKAYNATIDVAFDCNGQRTKIESEKITYLMIEHDYENQVLPIIYLSVAVNNELYTKIMRYKDSAKFYLNINITNKRGVASLSKNIINDTFNYMPSNTNPNYQQDLVDDDSVPDSTFKRIMIGLVSVGLTNKLRKSFNNFYNNIDQKTLIGLALEGTNCVIENIAYNESYKQILVPPLTSRYKFLEFIFNKDNFYDTKFRYFMDFEKSYLTSKCGNAIDAGDGRLTNTIIDIREITADESYYDGIAIKNGSYYIYVNPANSNVTLDQGTEKVANQIIALDDDTSVQKVNMNVNNIQGSDTKQVFIRTDNAGLYKNEMETNTAVIEIVKQHIDGSAFTPNKCITVNNYGDYAKYNGKYILVYKKEFFKCIAGEFVMSCNVGLKKVGNIQPAKTTHNVENSKYVSRSARRVSTANQR